MGKSITGKSSIVANLYNKGFTILSDELTGIVLNNSCITSVSSYATLKLWPNTLAALGYNEDDFNTIRPNVKKRIFPLNSQFTHQNKPVLRLYELITWNKNSACKIEKLNQKEAFKAIIANHFYLPAIQQQIKHQVVFNVVKQLTQKIEVRRLYIPKELNHLSEITSILLDDLTS